MLLLISQDAILVEIYNSIKTQSLNSSRQLGFSPFTAAVFYQAAYSNEPGHYIYIFMYLLLLLIVSRKSHNGELNEAVIILPILYTGGPRYGNVKKSIQSPKAISLRIPTLFFPMPFFLECHEGMCHFPKEGQISCLAGGRSSVLFHGLFTQILVQTI